MPASIPRAWRARALLVAEAARAFAAIELALRQAGAGAERRPYVLAPTVESSTQVHKISACQRIPFLSSANNLDDVTQLMQR
eukprot:143533-Pleurochrysis_carterae.AAC.3